MVIPKKLLAIIDGCDVVSFDVFDTAISRIYYSPTDLFEHIEKTFDVPDFKRTRIKAELDLRKEYSSKGINEITLDEIYAKIPSYHDYEDFEIKLELLYTHLNQGMYDVYDHAKKIGKRIVFTSDTYLPKEVIESILNKAGYEYDALYVSSDTKRPKCTGEMYEDILSLEDMIPQKIVHIGDNYWADYQIPKKFGIQSYHYSRPKHKVDSSYISCLRRSNDSVNASFIEYLIDTKSQNSNDEFWYGFGYKYCGILALSYVKWIKEKYDDRKADQLIFMMNNGYAFKKVFETLYPDVPVDEIYGSKMMYLLPKIKTVDDLKETMIDPDADMFITRGITYRTLFERYMFKDEYLCNQYGVEFEDIDSLIQTKEDVDRIVDFLCKHSDTILKEGEIERETLIRYFEQHNIFSKNSMIVNLGWDGTLLKSIKTICEMKNETANVDGLYLGTLRHNEMPFSESVFLMQNGISGEDGENSSLNPYVVKILDLVFSAPLPNVRRIDDNGGKLQLVYQNITEEGKKRVDVSEKVLSGIIDFVLDYSSLTEEYPMPISKNICYGVTKYLSSYVSKYDEMEIMRISMCYGPGADNNYFPITRHDLMNFAIVNPWPGGLSAESEVIFRLKKATDHVGLSLTMVDNFGYILDNETQNRTDVLVDPESLDFVISTHYESHKSIDAFYYHTVWNPPEIPLNCEEYSGRIGNNFLSYDDYLIYDTGVMSDLIRTNIMKKPRTLTGASEFVPSFPEYMIKKPNLSNPRLFYCGMNWEKLFKSSRHEGLFKLLDDADCVRFYGPEAPAGWGGIRPWEGYKNYCGEIPFDGVSILDEINNCGICLVLSSDIHRRSGAATNRLYEACAGGAVIISDDNEFVLKHFKDCAVFIKYNKNNPKDTFEQIMSAYEWIVTHKEEAIKLVENAQKVFREHYSLDRQLLALVRNHPNRFFTIRNDLFALSEPTVTVVSALTTNKLDDAQKMIDVIAKNCHNQYYRNIDVRLAVDESLYDELEKYSNAVLPSCTLHPYEMYDIKGVRKKTIGQMIKDITNILDEGYFIITNPDEIWYYDHVTTLVRTMQDSKDAISAYSALSSFPDDHYVRCLHFDVLNDDDYFAMDNLYIQNSPGMFIFNNKINECLGDYIFSNIDGLEHYAYCSIISIIYKKQIVFSKRMTILNTRMERNKDRILSIEMQIRMLREMLRFDYRPVRHYASITEDASARNERHATTWEDRLAKITLFFKKVIVKIMTGTDGEIMTQKNIDYCIQKHSYSISLGRKFLEFNKKWIHKIKNIP